MTRLQAESHLARDAMSAGLLSFGEQMLVCFGAVRAGGHPLRRWLARLLRRDDAAGMEDRQRKDIGLPPHRLPLSTDAATRLEIRTRR